MQPISDEKRYNPPEYGIHRDVLRDAFNDCRGSRYPLLWNESTGDIANAKLVRFTHDELSQNQIEYQIFQPTVELEELPYIDDGDTY